MKIVLQRVQCASVVIAGETIASIDKGLLLLLGFGNNDLDQGEATLLEKMDTSINKIVNLRVFSNDAGKLDHSILDISGGILVVPQFTLYGETRKGRRPDFVQAMNPGAAEGYFLRWCDKLQSTAVKNVESGRFGADMQAHLVNDGPLTLLLEY